jgi:16S rRNA (cytosine967-C5)-methyltransferase
LGFTRIPSHAVLDQANRMAHAAGMGGMRGLVNGVLRKADRKGPELFAERDALDWLLPDWLAQQLIADHGREAVASWAEAWRQPPVWSYWSAGGEPLDENDLPSPTAPRAFRRENAITPGELADRPIYIQNESSQILSEILCRARPESVLDMCAAPGGKSHYIAAFQPPRKLVANDVSANRMAALRENQLRLGQSFETMVGDAAGSEFPTECYDAVLLDAPCTGIGVIGRHPEIKLLKKTQADEGLLGLQRALLEAAWARVSPGGLLLYSVCTLAKAETPPLPAGAEPVGAEDELISWIDEALLIRDADRPECFTIQPSRAHDGFRAMLARKPAAN